MQKKKQLFTLLAIACSLWSNAQSGREITPNDFTGSDTVGIGILHPEWNHHIHIIGIGDVHLKGADNPRSTGDAYRSLILTPEAETNWRVSYGSDAGIHHVYVDGVITYEWNLYRSCTLRHYLYDRQRANQKHQ